MQFYTKYKGYENVLLVSLCVEVKIIPSPLNMIFHGRVHEAGVTKLLSFVETVVGTLYFHYLPLIMLRSSFVEETANPWSPSSTYIHVGSLQNILTFAEKTGHIDRVIK